jgi:choline dehydrogenase
MRVERDYVVIGGGSAGCVVAGELSAAGYSVALLEAGDAAEEHPESLRADGYKDAFVNDALMHERFTTRQAACGSRRLFAGTGRGMGGSGAINAMVYTRGAREDFEEFGEGWRWDDVVPHFEAVEKTLDVRRRAPTTFTEACIRAAEETGFRRKEDLNDGDLRDVLGYEWMNYRGDERRNAYVAYVKERPSPRLGVHTRTTAIRLDVGAHGDVRGVFARGPEGEMHFVAGRETIVCLGALASPALLLRSGIGPEAELRALGIDVVANLPGVGRNLHDHPNVTLFFRGRGEVDAHYPQLYGFGRVGDGPGPSDSCFVFYPARSSFREGMIRMLPAMLFPGDQGVRKRAVRGAVSGLFAGPVKTFVERMWGIVVILGKPNSRGSVRLGSRDPEQAPFVDPAYLTDPADLERMLRGIERARKIATSSSLAEHYDVELLPGKLSALGRGREAADLAFLRQNLMTTYHYAGTCKLGDDPECVVDRQLRVRGVRRLRVADASIIPVTPVSALNAPSMMIGRRAADFLRRDTA